MTDKSYYVVTLRVVPEFYVDFNAASYEEAKTHIFTTGRGQTSVIRVSSCDADAEKPFQVCSRFPFDPVENEIWMLVDSFEVVKLLNQYFEVDAISANAAPEKNLLNDMSLYFTFDIGDGYTLYFQDYSSLKRMQAIWSKK